MDIRRRDNVPVNVIGVGIGPTDATSLRIWRNAGVDKLVRAYGERD
jgi:hypothetical protein